jgi:branched-subunit amino acid aminotransferase/4-amino-4-deoxychorismate lyase
MRVIIDGVGCDDAAATVSVFDWALVRGFGVFEVVRVYGEALFRLEAHLDRLEKSAAALAIPMPERRSLAGDMATVAAANGSGQVRAILTGGGRDPLVVAPPRVVVMWEPLPAVPETVRVLPVIAPWHPATSAAGFPGVKWTSYAPNMAVTDRVRSLGYDEAMLLSTDGIVLEGPTFAFAWVRRDRIETPTLDLGILPSITRDVVLECCGGLGLEVEEGRYPVANLVEADEVLALSTVKQVIPVDSIGEHAVPRGVVAGRLAAAFAAVVSTETGWSGPAAGTTP